MALISGRPPAPGASVRAVTVTSDVIAVPELVMNAFSPLITHSPAASSSTARVRVPPASLPASGSVSPNPPRARPAHRSGSHRWRCSSVPNRKIGLAPEADAGLEGDGHRLVDPGDLLDGDAQRGEVGAAAAVLLRERQAEQPELAHRQHGVDREGVVAVPLLGVRRDGRRRRSRAPPCGAGSCSSVSSMSRSDRTGRSAAGRGRCGPDSSPGWPVPSDPAPLAVVGGPAADRPGRRHRRTSPPSTPTGCWAVVLPFDGPPVCARFATRAPGPRPGRAPRGRGAAAGRGLDAVARRGRVPRRRGRHPRGDRRRRRLPGQPHPPAARRRLARRDADVAALGAALAVGNPAPYSAVVRLPAQGVHVASASPERFLERDGRPGPVVARSRAPRRPPDGFLAKDRAENVMIVDLVRNDLGRVCEWGTVTVPALLRGGGPPGPGPPGLARSRAGCAPGSAGPTPIEATFPPGLGDRRAEAGRARRHRRPRAGRPRASTAGRSAGSTPTGSAGALNVAIRTFWLDDGRLHFGTGGGITWDSDPDGEWAETELKAGPARRPGQSSPRRRARATLAAG